MSRRLLRALGGILVTGFVMALITGGCAVYRNPPSLQSSVARTSAEQVTLDVREQRGDLVIWPWGTLHSAERSSYLMIFRLDHQAARAPLIKIRDITGRETDYPSDKDLYDELAQQARVKQALVAWGSTTPLPVNAFRRDARRSDGDWLVLIEDYPERFDWAICDAAGIRAWTRIFPGITAPWGWDVKTATVIMADWEHTSFYLWHYRDPNAELTKFSLNWGGYFEQRDGRAILKTEFAPLLAR